MDALEVVSAEKARFVAGYDVLLLVFLEEAGWFQHVEPRARKKIR
jgi:hypothetical protein